MNLVVNAKTKYRRYYQLKYLVESIRGKNETCNHIETNKEWIDRILNCHE